MVNRLVSVGDDFTLPAAVKAADVNLPERLSEPSLSATYVGQGNTAWTDAEPLLEVYTSGSGAAFHLASQPGFTGPYLAGYGIDTDGAIGQVISIKANGIGQSIDQWPAGGVGLQGSNRSAIAFQNTDIYVGAGGIQYALKSGAHFTDGVLVAGQSTITSATAAFVAGDVGKVLATTQPRPNDLPAGTTIVSITSATEAVLSAPAAASRTGVSFSVAGRLPAATQKALSILDTDTFDPLFQVRKGSAIIAVPVFARNSSTSAFRVYGVAGQTADLQSWRDSNTNILSRVDANGYMMTRKSAAPADAALANGEAAFWVDSTNGAAKLMVKAKQADGTVRTGSVVLA